ncbi:MAG: hypothetical protein U9N84_12485 [Actinomycetota bacterium]|nr:hypothetical protein [Actinomycetota bacterium]
MDITPEQVLEELLEIGQRLDTLAPDAAERESLEARRADLRLAAQEVADATRNREILAEELKHLEQRLADFEDEKINVPGWQIAMTSGGRFSINDPAAHAYKLNETLDDKTELDRASIEQRIGRLKKALDE